MKSGGELNRPRLQKTDAPTLGDKIKRIVWRSVAVSLFRFSPVHFHAWRRLLLRLFGAKIGKGAHPYPSCQIWAPWNLVMERGSCLGPNAICYSVGVVQLGENSTISQGVHLCAATHDHRDANFPLLTGEIWIGNDVWIAADAFVGPGIRIGDRVVVGARSVVVRDVDDGCIVAGNPAVNVGRR